MTFAHRQSAQNAIKALHHSQTMEVRVDNLLADSMIVFYGSNQTLFTFNIFILSSLNLELPFTDGGEAG